MKLWVKSSYQASMNLDLKNSLKINEICNVILFLILTLMMLLSFKYFDLSAGAVEYTKWTSAEK